MPLQSVSVRPILFWTLAISLISSISTVIFSESFMSDSLGSVVIIGSLIGLCAYGMFKLLDTVLSICNP